MQTGRIYERNLTHTDDADFRFISHTFHDAVELIRYAEKERTIDLVYLYTFRQGEDFLVMMNLALVGRSISSVVTDTCVVSATRRIKNNMAIKRPISIAIVRSKITVRKKVTNKTDTSLFGFFIKERNVRHSLIL